MVPLQLQYVSVGQKEVAIYVPVASAVKENLPAQGLFWSRIWPASIALSQFLQEHSYFINGKEVLELGGGLGLPSIVAASFARHVTCTDSEAEAMHAVHASAAYHKLKNVSTAVYNWQHLPLSLRADVLLLSDVSYNPDSFEPLYQMLSVFINCGTTILFSTPQRLTARAFMEPLMPWCVLQKEYILAENEQPVYTTVFVLKGINTG